MTFNDNEYYKISLKDENGNDAYAFFKINEGKLETYKSDNFKGNGFKGQVLNPATLNKAEKDILNDKDAMVKRIIQGYRKMNEDEDYSKQPFINSNEVEIKIENYTKQIEAEQKKLESKKEKSDTKELEQAKQKAEELNSKWSIVREVPENVKNIFQSKERKIDENIYTEKLFQMTKNIFNTPKNLLINVSEDEQNQIKKLLAQYKNCKDENEMRKVFENFLTINKKNLSMKTVENIYQNTLKKGFKGFEKKLSSFEKEEMKKNAIAVKEGKFPIMNAQDNIDYIRDIITNKLLPAYAQFMLHRDNSLENKKESDYAYVPSLYQNGGMINPAMKTKCYIVPSGYTPEGKEIFSICVPARNTLTREQRAQRKLEYKKNLMDLKYQYKFGHLPEQTTKVIQKPIQGSENLEQNRANRNENFESIVSNDINNFFTASLNKKPYAPSIDYFSENNMKNLMHMVLYEPEIMKKIIESVFDNIQERIKQNQNQNQVDNTNVQNNENSNSKKRVRS